jgi:hypothetical protein
MGKTDGVVRRWPVARDSQRSFPRLWADLFGRLYEARGVGIIRRGTQARDKCLYPRGLQEPFSLCDSECIKVLSLNGMGDLFELLESSTSPRCAAMGTELH